MIATADIANTVNITFAISGKVAQHRYSKADAHTLKHHTHDNAFPIKVSGILNCFGAISDIPYFSRMRRNNMNGPSSCTNSEEILHVANPMITRLSKVIVSSISYNSPGTRIGGAPLSEI